VAQRQLARVAETEVRLLTVIASATATSSTWRVTKAPAPRERQEDDDNPPRQGARYHGSGTRRLQEPGRPSSPAVRRVRVIRLPPGPASRPLGRASQHEQRQRQQEDVRIGPAQAAGHDGATQADDISAPRAPPENLETADARAPQPASGASGRAEGRVGERSADPRGTQPPAESPDTERQQP